MRKDSKKNINKHGSESLAVHRVRRMLKDWDIKVMSYVMLVVVLVALITATVAWFLYFKVVAVSHIGMTTADCDTIKVEVKQGMETEGNTAHFVEVKEGEENNVLVDLDMPLFDNVESYEVTSEVTSGAVQTEKVSKMAPGVYGSLTIRLTSLNKEINRYRIAPETLLTYIEGSGITVVEEAGEASETVIDSEDRILRNLAKGHILFFKNRVERTRDENGTLSENVEINGESRSIKDYVHNKKYVFYDQIESEDYMEGDLGWDETKNVGTPKEVIIYWYWPYEYGNLSSDIQNSIQLSDLGQNVSGIVFDITRLKYFDKDKMQDIVNGSVSWNETQLYDYADTRLGTYVKSVKVRLKVDGYHATGQTQTEQTE